MRVIGTLFSFEMKKILARKSTWITFAVLLGFYFVFTLMPLSVQYAVTAAQQETDSSGGAVKTDSYTETFWDEKIKRRDNGIALSGRKLDDDMLQEMWRESEALGKKRDSMSLQEYDDKAKRYKLADSAITSLLGEENPTSDDGSIRYGQLMEGRNRYIVQMQDHYQLSDAERKFWQQREKKVDKPFTLQYAEPFENLVRMPGCYMGLLLVTFLIAVAVSRIFTEEHARKVDQLALSSRYGKRHLYFAKILAGTVFTFIFTAAMTGVIFLTTFILYGTEGASCAVQLFAGWYSYPMSMGEAALIMLGIEFLAALLTSIFTMVVSERFRSNITAIALVTGITIGGRLLTVPAAFRVLSQIWNYLPINLLKEENFFDLRLVSLFGVKFTCWQFAPILYSILGILLVLLGKRIYCNYQVGGKE